MSAAKRLSNSRPERQASSGRSRPLAFVLAVLAASAPAAAQAPTDSLTSDFLRIQANPADHEASYRYISAAVAERDYEAAIGALEKLILFNPRLTRAKYELGVLYFRLKSYDMATRYFEDALATGGLEDEIRRRIDIMLPAARKEMSSSRVYGVLQAGVGFNSNVTQAHGFGPVRAFGAWALNPNAVPRQSAATGSLLGDITHVYDFQTARGDTWETRVRGIGALPTSRPDYTAGYLEVSTGPRLAISPEFYPGATVRPYVIGDFGTLGAGERYRSGGAGVSARLPMGEFFRLEPVAEWRRIDAADTTSPFASQFIYNTGALWTLGIGAQWMATDWLTLQGRAAFVRNASFASWASSRQMRLEGSAKVDFDAPFPNVGWRWSVTPFVRYAAYNFDGADPLVDPWMARRDRQWRAGAQLDMPITRDWGLSAVVQYTSNASNIPNFSTSSWSGMIGPTYRFTSLFDRPRGATSAGSDRATTADWAGFYAGLSAVSAFGGDRTVRTAAFPFYENPVWVTDEAVVSSLLASGGRKVGGAAFGAGLQAGFNRLVSPSMLAGVEADIQAFAPTRRGASWFAAAGAGFGNTIHSINNVTRSVDYLATLRGRAGFLVAPGLLAFGSAGVAFGGVRAGTNIAQLFDGGWFQDVYLANGRKAALKAGWTAGGGVEWMFAEGWSAKVEHLYYDLGRASHALSPLVNANCWQSVCYGNAVRASARFNGHVVRAGLNYHFNLDDPPALVR